MPVILSAMTNRQRSVTVLGAGFTGLVIADTLAAHGDRVTVIECEEEAGGFCRSINLAGCRVERYYHHVFPNETNVVGLINRVGLSADLYWRRVRQGLIAGGSARSFDHPAAYLREALATPANLLNDWRFAARINSLDVDQLDRFTALEWLDKWQSPVRIARLWRPLLTKKFGPYAGQVSARWLAERITTRKSSKGWLQRGETLGHLAGGFHRLTDRLAERCVGAGVTFHYGVVVEAVGTREGRAEVLQTTRGELPVGDVLISTLPLPVLAKLLPETDDPWRRAAAETPYMHCRCVILALKCRLSPYYWLSNLDAAPFAAAIEQSHLFGDGSHLLYLPQYLAQPTDRATDDAVVREAMAWLGEVFPGFKAADVRESRVAYDAFAQPVFLAGDQRQKWQVSRPLPNLVATDAYLDYPNQRRNMNAAVRRAADVVKALN